MLLWLYLTLSILHSTMAFRDPILDSTTRYYGSTWLYLTLPQHCVTLLESTTLYHGSTWLYSTLFDPTSLYCTLPWVYLALLHSTWLYLSILYSTIALRDPILDSTMCYHGSTAPYNGSIDLTWLYTTLPWLHFNLLGSTPLYHSSTWPYLTLLHSTRALTLLDSIMALLNSAWLYIIHFTTALYLTLYLTLQRTFSLGD